MPFLVHISVQINTREIPVHHIHKEIKAYRAYIDHGCGLDFLHVQRDVA